MPRKIMALVLAVLTVFAFSSCRKRESVVNIIDNASKIMINGNPIDTVEARMGAFSGDGGDYIEFEFDEPQMFNTVYITEKTATIREFNIFIKEGKNYRLIYTGKQVLADAIELEPITASCIKISIVSTDISNKDFIIQGISAYMLNDAGQEV